jgi:phosphoenolpyruvate carboxylase
VPALRERLSHRNHWVDPLSHLQVALLARSRAGDTTVGGALMATITGIAAGLRNTG